MAKYIVWPDAYTADPMHFSNFPGLYGVGLKVAVEDTGMSEEELEVLIAKGGYPLEIVEDSAQKIEVKENVMKNKFNKGGEI